MIEHSCCCIWDFVMSALNQIHFGFENSLKFGFEKLEKKKEIHLHSVLAQLAAWQRAVSACPPARGPLLLFPASRLGRAQPAAWLARACAFLPSPSLTPRVHKSGPPPSSSRRQRHLPNTSPIEFPPSISSFLV
jgi:hypothetical protein